jgi:hydrogenase assembly chaperone HypC/HupF
VCLAIPARVVELLDGDDAVVDLAGVRKRISLALVDGVVLGDHVIVQSATRSRASIPTRRSARSMPSPSRMHAEAAATPSP